MSKFQVCFEVFGLLIFTLVLFYGIIEVISERYLSMILMIPALFGIFLILFIDDGTGLTALLKREFRKRYEWEWTEPDWSVFPIVACSLFLWIALTALGVYGVYHPWGAVFVSGFYLIFEYACFGKYPYPARKEHDNKGKNKLDIYGITSWWMTLIVYTVVHIIPFGGLI